MNVPALPRPPLRALAAALLLAITVALLTGDAAYAAADIENAGKNIAETLKTWSVALFAGVTGIMAIFYLTARKIGPALGFAALAMLVGAFVFAPQLMGGAAADIAKTVLK